MSQNSDWRVGLWQIFDLQYNFFSKYSYCFIKIGIKILDLSMKLCCRSLEDNEKNHWGESHLNFLQFSLTISIVELHFRRLYTQEIIIFMSVGFKLSVLDNQDTFQGFFCFGVVDCGRVVNQGSIPDRLPLSLAQN